MLRGQLAQVVSLIPPCGSLGWNWVIKPGTKHNCAHCFNLTGLSSGFLKTVHSVTSETIVMTLWYPNLLKSLAVTWTLIDSNSQKCFLWSYTLIIWKTLAVCMCLCLNSPYWHILLSHIKFHGSISLPRLHQEVVWARETVSLSVAGTSFPKFIGNGYHQLFSLKWQAVHLVHFPENVFQTAMSE